jgi:hypothetical protein
MRDDFKIFNRIFIVMVILVIAMLVFRGALIFKSFTGNETIYQVNVNRYNDIETYLTNKYEKDEKTGCIKFKDEFGIKRIVCNNYTITEY